MDWMCSHGLHLNFVKALWGDTKVELGKIWGRVGGPEALEVVKAAWNSSSEEQLEGLMPTRLQADWMP